MNDLEAITILLPAEAFKKLKKLAEAEDKSLEELVGEAIFRQLGITDPQAKAELHLKLCEKYLKEAEEFLAKGDYVQASEKAWGASSQMLKALAAKEGKELRSHADLWKYMDILAEKLGDDELRHLWRTANALHQNFYENWMPPREVKLSIKDVKTFIKRLKELFKT
ncbi:MAG: PaREP1 family protein [Candidatus Baldrarchaeia archaeon]